MIRVKQEKVKVVEIELQQNRKKGCRTSLLKLYLSRIKVVSESYQSCIQAILKLYVHVVVNMVNQLLTLLSSKKRYSRESCQKICLSRFTREFCY